MAKSKIVINRINKNIKNKIKKLNIEGADKITFTHNSACIYYDDSMTDINRIMDRIKDFGLNGHFEEDQGDEHEHLNNAFTLNEKNNEKLTSFSFYSDNKNRKEQMNKEKKITICEESKTNTCEINSNNELNNEQNIKEKKDISKNNINVVNDKISTNNDSIYMKDLINDKDDDTYIKEKLTVSPNSILNDNKNNKNEEDNDTYLSDSVHKNEKNYEKNGDDSVIKNKNTQTGNGSEIPFHRNNENIIDEGEKEKKKEKEEKKKDEKDKEEEKIKEKRQNDIIMNLLTHFTNEKNRNIYETRDYIKVDRTNLSLENKEKNNVFYDYENYRSETNIYICELKIYNMTCDNCGRKIINFLKNKNLIIEGSSFATENKIKLKINISENTLHCYNIKNYVNKIMNEIKDSGFDNDLLDVYKDDDNNNNTFFEITLYVYRDDVIKSYELLKDFKGIKNIEYDVKKEYIYILYNPEIIGIRYILEELKKKKNIDAYYDEDKEKYFKSTKQNEKDNTWKLIELIFCFILSAIIIILNNYQMNMGYMNSFYSYINNSNYVMDESLSTGFIKNDIFHNMKNNSFIEPITKSNLRMSNKSKTKDYYTNKKNEKKKNHGTNDDFINKRNKEHLSSSIIKKDFNSSNNIHPIKCDIYNNEDSNCKEGNTMNYTNKQETSELGNIDNSKNIDTSFNEIIRPKDSDMNDINNLKIEYVDSFKKDNTNSKNPKNIDTNFNEIISSDDSKMHDINNKETKNIDSFKKDTSGLHDSVYKNIDNLKNSSSYMKKTVIFKTKHKNYEENKTLKREDEKKINKYETKNLHNQKNLKGNDSMLEKTSNKKTNKRSKLRKMVSFFIFRPFYKLIVYSFNIKLDTKILPSLTIRLLLIFILSSIVYIYYGYNFVLNGYKNLKNKIINMNVLISISSSFSYFYSLILLLFCILLSIDTDGIPLYFDSSALLICIMKFGFEIENFLVSFTKKKIENLYERKTKHVYILEKSKDEEKKIKNESTNYIHSTIENKETPISNGNNSSKNNSNNRSNKSSHKEGTVFTFSNNKSILSGNDFNNENKKDLLFNCSFHDINKINKILYEDKNINLTDYIINSYPIQFIQKHDILVFYEGMTLLIDGIKINNEVSCVDESMISGEKKLIKKHKGDKVYAGSKCVEGIIIIYVNDISKGNYIEYVKKMLEEINCKKTNLQLYADKIANIFIPTIILLCFVVFTVWFFLTFYDFVNIKRDNYFKLNKFFSCILFSIHFSLSILCVACPCAIGLASPLSIAISSYICSNIGIIIKNVNIFEIFLQCNHFIFDKTGTLTVGKPVVNKIYISNNMDIFIDQLLKNFNDNNILVNFSDSTTNDVNSIPIEECEYNKKYKKNRNCIYNNTDTINNFNNNRSYLSNLSPEIKQSSFSYDDYSNGIVMENSYVINKKFDIFYRNKEIKKKEKKKENESNNALNFIESFSCSNRNVTFYSFTTKKDYYNIEMKGIRKKKEKKRNQRDNQDKQKPHHSKEEKSILNSLASFVNDRKKKKKYNRILDNSLKEHFINNSENYFSSSDNSYYSETSNNDYTNIFTHNKLNNNKNYKNKNIINANDCKLKNNLSDGNEYFKNNSHFDDKNNLKEKISNWLYLFLSLSLNIEKYSNHLFAESINKFINNVLHIKEKFEVCNLINEKNQGISCIINDLSITIGTLFYCYTKYKNTFCTKPEMEQEKLNVKNMETYLYSCDCDVHKTYQFLYNYSNSKKNEGNNIIFMCIEGIIIGFFTLVDKIKPEVFDLIKYLKKKKKKVYVCTGDNYMNALYISKMLRISKENISSNTLPLEKVHFVKKIKSLNDGKVCMIGDGINDCFALKSADLGLSLSTRSNVVMDSADGCIVDNNIDVIIKFFEISKKTLLVIKFNFLFSFLINIFFILLASGAFYSLNYVFSPFLFTFLMFCSSIIVILSSLSLKLLLRNI